MNKLFRRILALGCFLFAINFGHAQPVVTEYFVMKEAIKLDLTDKKVQKTVYTKGVLDIIFSTSNLTLAVTYDAGQTNNTGIMKMVQDLVSLNSAAGIPSKPTNTK